MKKLFKYHLKQILNIKDKSNWCLGYFKSDDRFKFSNTDLINNINNAIIFKPPKDQFWADPFLFNYKKKNMFFLKNFIKKKIREL